MQKTLALTTALILALTIPQAAALDSPDARDITGIWHLNAIEVEGVLMNTAAWETGIEVYMTLTEDNTVVRCKTGENDEEGIWMLEDGYIVITVDDTRESYVLRDGNLITEGFGVRMHYGKEKLEAEPFELPTRRTDTTLVDFDGEWIGYGIYMDGRILPLFMAIIFETTLTIEDGRVAWSVASDTSFRGEYAGNLENGALVATSQSDIPNAMETLVLSIREDGTLSTDFEDDFFILYKKS